MDGPYRWENHITSLRDAVKVFSRWSVGTNLIVGLGETEEEAVRLMQKMRDIGVEVVLFAFTPVRETRLSEREQPKLEAYRRIQIARYLLYEEGIGVEDVIFDEGGAISGFKDQELMFNELRDGAAFQTNGCPGCNRPFYNERPSGPFYNYPRPLREGEALKELESTRIDWYDR